MISNQQAKFVKSLKLKKYRRKASAFLVEGAKTVLELMHSDFEVLLLLVTEKFIAEYGDSIDKGIQYEIVKSRDLISLGTFKSNDYALAVAKMKLEVSPTSEENLVLALDGVSDPGNFGTIIRIADWYNIKTLIAGNECAELYNPKVITASMGSFVRVNVWQTDLRKYLELQTERRVYGAFLDGQDVHNLNPDYPCILLMGSESNGIQSSVEKYVDERLTIPRVGSAESLNVAVSTGIICDQLAHKLKN